MGFTLFVVVPCYNEEAVLPETAKRLRVVLESLVDGGKIHKSSRVLFVNDGSKDSTWEIIKKLHGENSFFAGLNLAKNSGHQNALFAGLMYSKKYADITISMDSDLQDDINAACEMIEKAHEGFDIVYGVRSKRDTDSLFKRSTAVGFYKLMRLMGVEMVYNHADYRLMNKRALDALSDFREVNLFLRGLVPMIGMRQATVLYERGERFAGESKYPLGKMLKFALEGVTSLSVKPIRMISVIGFMSFVASMIMLVYFIIDYIRGGTIAGWASTIVSIWAIGGLQLLAIGIIGEYIGKIYLEVKQRPRYIVQEELIGEETGTWN